jgi:hypothetical protein
LLVVVVVVRGNNINNNNGHNSNSSSNAAATLVQVVRNACYNDYLPKVMLYLFLWSIKHEKDLRENDGFS